MQRELSHVDHPGDVGTEMFDEELSEGRREELEEELRAIERAERRLEEGRYGISGARAAGRHRPRPRRRGCSRSRALSGTLARRPSLPACGGLQAQVLVLDLALELAQRAPQVTLDRAGGEQLGEPAGEARAGDAVLQA